MLHTSHFSNSTRSGCFSDTANADEALELELKRVMEPKIELTEEAHESDSESDMVVGE